MAYHAKYPLRRPCALQDFGFDSAVVAFEAIWTECLIPCQDHEILNALLACAATTITKYADEGSVLCDKVVSFSVALVSTSLTAEQSIYQ